MGFAEYLSRLVALAFLPVLSYLAFVTVERLGDLVSAAICKIGRLLGCTFAIGSLQSIWLHQLLTSIG